MTTDTHSPATNEHARLMYLLAVVVVAIILGAVAFGGLGGLILFGVGATWLIIALLVVMTAGG